MLFMIFSWDAYIVIPYMFFLGASSGFTYTSHPAIIAEMYGTKYLGSIKSLLTSLTVLGSAIGPVIFGGLIDFNIKIETIFIYFSLLSSNTGKESVSDQAENTTLTPTPTVTSSGSQLTMLLIIRGPSFRSMSATI